MPKKHRNHAAVLGAAVVAGVAPAAAQAHHVASGTAKCDLVSNVPTITASANFVGFTTAQAGLSGVLKVDGTVVQTVSHQPSRSPGSTGTWNSAPKTVTAGPHHVTGTSPGRPRAATTAASTPT